MRCLIAPMASTAVRARGPLAGGGQAEAHAVLVALGADPEHVGEVELHRAVIGLDLVPALAAESGVEGGELLVAHPQGERRAGLEADADALGHGVSVPSGAGRSP